MRIIFYIIYSILLSLGFKHMVTLKYNVIKRYQSKVLIE